MVWNRYAELSCWLISKESQLRMLRNRASDPRKYGQVKATITVSYCHTSNPLTSTCMVPLKLCCWFIDVTKEIKHFTSDESSGLYHIVLLCAGAEE